MTKIQELVSAGARSEKEVRRHLKIFVQRELYRGQQEPLKTIRRFYPSEATIRSHIYKSIVKEKLSKIDQEDLLRKVELWEKTSPDDSFAYHPYATYASEEESTRPEEDSGRESGNEGEDERIIKTSKKGLLFFHQSKDQRRLLEWYGNEICMLQSSPKILETPMHVPFPLQCWDVIAKLRGYNNIAKGRGKTKGSRIFQSVSRFLSKIVDATYKTTRYSLPLFFVVVKTNVDYQIVGSFVVQSETTDAIFEALSVLKSWNQKWNPSCFMVDYSEEEMSAIGNLFPGSSISNCLKEWLINIWVLKNIDGGVALTAETILTKKSRIITVISNWITVPWGGIK